MRCPAGERQARVQDIADHPVGKMSGELGAEPLVFSRRLPGYRQGERREVLFDNMKTVVLERNTCVRGVHRFHPGFLDYAPQCPYRSRPASNAPPRRTEPRLRKLLPLALSLIRRWFLSNSAQLM